MEEPAAKDRGDPGLARDHLANERTFLAWTRTAAGVMVLGLAVAKLVENGGTRPVAAGIILVVTGVAGMGYAGVRYRAVAAAIDGRRPSPAGRTAGPLVAGAVLIAAIAAALALLLW
jgi:putative membrane protein